MNEDVRSAIQRATEPFQPPDDLESRVMRRKGRRERTSRVVVGVTALAIFAASALLVVRVFPLGNGEGSALSEGTSPTVSPDPSPSTEPSPEPTPSPTAVPPDCPSPGPSGYNPTLSAMSGAPGSTITMSGLVPFISPDGEYHPQPTEWFEVWWNGDPDLWWTLLPGDAEPAPAGPGPVVQLTTVDVAYSCSFSTEFTVPDVPTGTYTIVVLSVDPESATILSELTFDVTS